MRSPNCPDCGVTIGDLHNDNCDVEICACTGRQRISCLCGCQKPRLRWSGEWPGVTECFEFGWTVGTTIPDLDRLRFPFARWNPETARWDKDPGAPVSGPYPGGLWRVFDDEGREAFFDLSKLLAVMMPDQRHEAEERLGSLSKAESIALTTVLGGLQITLGELEQVSTRAWQARSGS